MANTLVSPPSSARPTTLRIELDDPERWYWRDDIISGVVHVDGDHWLMSAEHLVVGLRRFAPPSKADDDGSLAVEVRLPEPASASERSFRFWLRCPWVAASHEGRLFDVGWMLEASLRSAAGDRVNASPVLVIVRPPPDATMRLRLKSTPAVEIVLGFVFLLMFSLVFSAAGLLIIYSAWAKGVPLLNLLFSSIFAVVGLAMMAFSVSSLIAELGIHRLGLSLALADPRVLLATLRFHPLLSVRSLTVTLLVKESAEREHAKAPAESGTGSMVHWIVHRQVRHIAVGGNGTQQIKLAFEWPDPNVVGWSQDSSDFKRTWIVTVAAVLEGWRNPAERHFTVYVEPGPRLCHHVGDTAAVTASPGLAVHVHDHPPQ